MLNIIPFDSLHLKHHLETSIGFDTMQPTPILDELPLVENRPATSESQRKQIPQKRMESPSKPKSKK